MKISRLTGGALGAIVLAGVMLAASLAAAQSTRSATLVAGDKTRLTLTQSTPTLPATFDANSVRIFVTGGPITFCAGQNYVHPCITIFNKMIACELVDCFAGAGDWRNRIRSVRFD